MTPLQAYEWLAPKLSIEERKILDVVFNAVPIKLRDIGKYGCHCDLEPGMIPDKCVFDTGNIEDCTNAIFLNKQGLGKESCNEWKAIEFGELK